MSLFISLSSTSKIFGMLVSPALGGSGSNRHLPCLAVCYVRYGGRIVLGDSRSSCASVFFHEDGEPVTLDRFDQVIGGSQVQPPGLVVHDGNHDYRSLRQL